MTADHDPFPTENDLQNFMHAWRSFNSYFDDFEMAYERGDYPNAAEWLDSVAEEITVMRDMLYEATPWPAPHATRPRTNSATSRACTGTPNSDTSSPPNGRRGTAKHFSTKSNTTQIPTTPAGTRPEG
jgi:hypothetical protein